MSNNDSFVLRRVQPTLLVYQKMPKLLEIVARLNYRGALRNMKSIRWNLFSKKSKMIVITFWHLSSAMCTWKIVVYLQVSFFNVYSCGDYSCLLDKRIFFLTNPYYVFFRLHYQQQGRTFWDTFKSIVFLRCHETN